MKGIAEVEFIISVFVFVTTISFVTFLILSSIPLFHNTAFSDGLKARSYQYSELLLFDEGSPKDWQTNPNDADRFGFSTGRRYFVDRNKLGALNSLCSAVGGYNLLKQKLGLTNFDIIIETSYLDGTPVIGGSSAICKPAVSTRLRPQLQTTRLGVLSTDSSIVKIKTVMIG